MQSEKALSKLILIDWFLLKCDCGHHLTDYPFIKCNKCNRTSWKSPRPMKLLDYGYSNDSRLMFYLSKYADLHCWSLGAENNFEIQDEHLELELVDQEY